MPATKRKNSSVMTDAEVRKRARTLGYRAAQGRTLTPAERGVDRRAGYYGRFTGPAAELKFFDTTLNFTADTTAEVPATGQLSLIPQGVTESTRVGRKCTIKSIQINGVMTHVPAAAATSSFILSVALVQDTQTNGAAAAVSDVYDMVGNALPVSVRNIENGDRFKILKRWDIPFTSASGVTTAYNNVSKKWDFYKKCQIPLEFSSTTGAITELKSNNVFIVAGTSTAAADDTVTVNGICRLRFSDN